MLCRGVTLCCVLGSEQRDCRPMRVHFAYVATSLEAMFWRQCHVAVCLRAATAVVAVGRDLAYGGPCALRVTRAARSGHAGE